MTISVLSIIMAAAISLNGSWDLGKNRDYTTKAEVPGVHTDPSKMNEGELWYRRSVTLPQGDWTEAVLELKGARFRPRVYVDGTLVSSQEGGMIRSFHPLQASQLKPGATITLEIALSSLRDVPQSDASYIPESDQWRSNCASCLWDDVVLHLNSGARTDRLIVFTDTANSGARFKYRVHGSKAASARISLSGSEGKLMELKGTANEGENEVSFALGGKLQLWSPEHPVLYEAVVELLSAEGKVLDSYSQNVGFRDFKVDGKHFALNGEPIFVRGGTVVWHRWLRDAEAREVAWDAAWIEKNMVKRLKDHGANYFRFHLGVPPERILDLCDKYGLIVQYEWNFFHGMPASEESLVEQYGKWLDMASRHPSVAMFHPYNETSPDQLVTVWKALDKILPQYPGLVFEERDVIHVHKYWWSLFENLGLYYDSYDQFPKPIMVDEFGGNYLDGYGEMGLYPAIPGAFLRFLGPNHNAESRLYHLNRSCAKVAEYWRRLGAAGVSPFVIASSREDGCHWFTGPLKDGNPKTVWDALTVLWSDISLSMDIWDKNFTPSQKVSVPLHLFNESSKECTVGAVINIVSDKGTVCTKQVKAVRLAAHGRKVIDVTLTMPAAEGNYSLVAKLSGDAAAVHPELESRWDVRVLRAVVPATLIAKKVFVPEQDEELRIFVKSHKMTPVSDPTSADIILIGKDGFGRMPELSEKIDAALRKGISAVLLDLGERGLGANYPSENWNIMDNLQSVAKVRNAVEKRYPLFRGLTLVSRELPEPESHIHNARGNNELWNGLRAGLIVPAFDLKVEGLAGGGGSIRYKYDLCGVVEYSDNPDDKALVAKLRARVKFLLDDAPALGSSLNPDAKVHIEKVSESGSVQSLAKAGSRLSRNPVLKIGFGEGEGSLILSQLLTKGRLSKKQGVPRLSERYDESAVQTVLDLMEEALK